ncbi:MAG: hypothetical protein HY236_15710 [Acidobacteria bacterium]|nr:hypothetical protein [Acidobacteriota bacterium]
MAEKTIDLDPFIADRNAPDPRVTVSVKDQETVTWFANQDFKILGARPEPDDPGKPDNPFHRPFPFDARLGTGNKFRANSGPALSEAAESGGKVYKIRFQVAGTVPGTKRVVDPHIIIVP